MKGKRHTKTVFFSGSQPIVRGVELLPKNRVRLAATIEGKAPVHPIFSHCHAVISARAGPPGIKVNSYTKTALFRRVHMKNQWLMQTLPLRLGIVPALLPCIGPATAASGTAQTAS